MVIGVCTIELHIPDQGSLKGKRQVLLSLKDRVRQKFNVSIAELEAQELWQRAVLGVACIGNEKRHINRQMDHVLSMIRRMPSVEIIQTSLEMI
jgi:uncharacterized protein YlxP (DUF503 family)